MGGSIPAPVPLEPKEFVLNVTTMLEPLLFKNMTERVDDVQGYLLYVMEEQAQELEGKVVRKMNKKLGELGSKLWGQSKVDW